MSTGVADIAIILALAVVVVVLGMVVWLVVQHRRERTASLAAAAAATDRASTVVQPAGPEVDALAALVGERSAAAEQALSAAQALLAEQVIAAERNVARAESLATAESDLASAREQVLEQRLELDLREQRVADREQRLAVESAGLRDEAARLAAAAAATEARTLDLTSLENRLADREVVVARLESERLVVLERAAGLTADEARAELVATVETQAKRRRRRTCAPSSARPSARRMPGPADRGRRDPAGGQRADRRERRHACCTCPATT